MRCEIDKLDMYEEHEIVMRVSCVTGTPEPICVYCNEIIENLLALRERDPGQYRLSLRRAGIIASRLEIEELMAKVLHGMTGVLPVAEEDTQGARKQLEEAKGDQGAGEETHRSRKGQKKKNRHKGA